MIVDSKIQRAAELLVEARHSGAKLDRLPVLVAPRSPAEAMAVQGRVMDLLGGAGGWKATLTPAGDSLAAPMPAAVMMPAPARLKVSGSVQIEGEIAFRMGRDLPAGRAYSRAEVIEAIEGACVGIEVMGSRLTAPAKAPRLDNIADSMNNGGFVFGGLTTGWRLLDLPSLAVTLTIGGSIIVDHLGGNSARDPLLVLTRLANAPAGDGTGLKAGQIVTTGSCTGVSPARAGERVTVRFAGLGDAVLDLVN